MGCTDMMKECRDYIDSHLESELSAMERARRYHYSYYHFCRIFQISNGMSVASYIREKRLELAAEKVKKGTGIFEAALEVGFETPSGFVKAFKKKFGCTPTEYLKMQACGIGGVQMEEPRFVALGPIHVLGHNCESDKKELDSAQDGAYWFREKGSEEKQKHHHGHMDENTVKIGLWLKEPDAQGNLSYFFGKKLEADQTVPEGLNMITIPAAEYAVFTTRPLDMTLEEGHKALAESIRETWKYIYEDWLETSGYDLDEEGYDFEYYDARCKDKHASCMDIYIPVRKHK